MVRRQSTKSFKLANRNERNIMINLLNLYHSMRWSRSPSVLTILF